MTDGRADWLAERFEEHRTRLRAVAYRMLGSLSEADDAVQEAWLRLSRTDASEVENLGALADDRRRARLAEHAALAQRAARGAARRPHARPDRRPRRRDRPGARGAAGRLGRPRAARRARDADPAERLAFVLHDMFAVPFDEIAPIVDRSPEAARQLASRARRRVQGETRSPDADLDTQREVVDAFLAAARDGDFEALLAVLDPDVVLRADFGPDGGFSEVRGAVEVAGQALRLLAASAWSCGRRSSTAPPERSRPLDGELYSVGAITVSEPEDRRHRHPRRPGAPAPARPDDPRRLSESRGRPRARAGRRRPSR